MVRIIGSSLLRAAYFTSDHPLDPDFIKQISFTKVTKGSKLTKELLAEYKKVYRVELPGEMSVTGDTVIMFFKHTDFVIRFELYGEEIEQISSLDLASLRKLETLNEVVLPIIPETEIPIIFHLNYDLASIPENAVNFFYKRNLQIQDKYYSLPIYVNKNKLWESDLSRYVQHDYVISYYGQNIESFRIKLESDLEKLVQENILPQEKVKSFLQNVTYTQDNNADKGFYSSENKIVVLTDQEIFGTLFFRSSIQNKNVSKLFDGEIKIGDYIVHDLHGVRIYRGIITQRIEGHDQDYIQIEYLNKDSLYVPYETSEKVSRFIGEGETPRLTKLGSAEWDNVRSKAKKDIEEIADELLELYARRELEKGFAYDIDKAREMFEQMVTEFGFEDTADQKRSTNEILEDMASEKPMDRLLVGDVGFGKTEIAVRAAYVAVLNNKQVLVLAPTTILVSQLYKVFSQRLAGHGVNISKVSRFEGDKKNEASILDLNDGKIDILVGTHRLLSQDIKPKNLGLLIIDEEQRFGVKQKEKIKSLKANIDVLAMSATPIPRTLQMSLSGIRDISVITTPPPGRMSVATSLLTKQQIYEPIRTELARGGQVFIVHNNISTIETLAKKISEKIPSARIAVGHAKMTGPKLEKIMLDFAERHYDVLIATTIIENGIDIPSVNTMIINEANTFGLSQLHQLRGRVGRSSTQAYCYLVVPYLLDEKIKSKKITVVSDDDPEQEPNDKEKKVTMGGIERIKAIIEYQALGSGFHIASKDLEIRGGGDILSASQSGHINTIGYDLYLRMLYQEIDKKKREK